MKLNNKDRKLVAEIICEHIDSLDADDLFSCFIDSNERTKRVEKLKGDVDTNPLIEEYLNHGLALIEMTLRNIKADVRKMTPLILTKYDIKK